MEEGREGDKGWLSLNVSHLYIRSLSFFLSLSLSLSLPLFLSLSLSLPHSGMDDEGAAIIQMSMMDGFPTAGTFDTNVEWEFRVSQGR